MKRTLLSALVLAFVCAGAFGWGGMEAPGAADSRASGSYRVMDALGRTLDLPEVPKRIVIAGRAVVSIVDALFLFPDAGERIAGVGATDQGLGDFYPILDPASATKARFANNVGPEQVAAAHPDLVILKSYMKDPLGDALERIGVPVLYVDLESPDAFAADITTLGALLRQPERARFILDYYTARVSDVRRQTSSLAKPTVLVIQYTESGGSRTFMIPPAGWIQTRLVETAGGEPVWRDAGTGAGWSRVGIEQIAAWNPRFVLVVSYRTPASSGVQSIASSPEWRGLRSVQEGGLLPFPADFYSWDQADTRWILGLQWLAGVLHPELSSVFDPRKAVSSFYPALYGLAPAAIESLIFPRLAEALERSRK